MNGLNPRASKAKQVSWAWAVDVYMSMMTPLQTCFAEHVKLGHDVYGPTAEIRTPTKNGIRRNLILAETVANWLVESQYIGGFRISSDSRSRQSKNIEALVFHHMQFFGGQDNIDTIRRNSNEAILNANQLVLRLASQVQVAETRIQELEASLMAAQTMSAAHEADSKLWERKALDDKNKNIPEIHKIGDSHHRNYGHDVINPTQHKYKLAPYHLVSPESQARIQSGCLHDLLANYARLCGDTGDMKAVLAAMRDSFLKYSTEVTPESNGVHKDHVLPCMVDLVMATPRWKDKLWKQFVKEHLDGIDIDKYIEIKEIKGLGQLCERALRSQVGLLLPAENRSLQATKDITRWAKRMFGELITWIRDSNRGTGVDVMKVCEGLLRKAFARCLQPHALNGMAGLQDAVDQKRRLVTGKIEMCRDECSTLVDGDVPDDEQENNAKRQKFEKLERQLENIKKAEAAALRNAHFNGSVIPDIKEECMLVPLLHLQAGGDGHQRPKAFLKFGVDGAVITSHVVNEQSKHWCAMVEVLNSGLKTNSVNNTFSFASIEGGDAQAGEVLEEVAIAMRTLRDEGLKVENVMTTTPDGEYVIIKEVHFDVDVKLTVDGAMLYYLCEGKCSGSANEPCPFCHDTKNKKKCSIGFVFQLVDFDNSVTTYGDVAKKYRINFQQLVDMNTEENEEKYQPLTVDAKGDTQASKRKPTRHLDTHTSPDAEVAPNGVSIRLRVPRLMSIMEKGVERRELIDIFAKQGITWKDVCMCVRHGDNRHLEWLVWLVTKHGMMWDDTKQCVLKRGGTIGDFNAWLSEHKCGMKLKDGDGKKTKIAKPSVSTGSQVDVWFEDDPIEPSKKRWECFLEKFDRRPQVRLTWAAYAKLRPTVMVQFPTQEQKLGVGPLCFDYLLQYRLAYTAADVHLYCHLYGMHAAEMMELHNSLGMYMNEAVENVHAQHKRIVRTHSLKGGCGSDMTEDVTYFDLRKLFRACREAWAAWRYRDDPSKLAELPRLSWAEYCDLIK